MDRHLIPRTGNSIVIDSHCLAVSLLSIEAESFKCFNLTHMTVVNADEVLLCCSNLTFISVCVWMLSLFSFLFFPSIKDFSEIIDLSFLSCNHKGFLHLEIQWDLLIHFLEFYIV